MWRAAFVGLGLAGVAACGGDFGGATTTGAGSGGAASSSTASGSGTGGSCAACAADVPDGWTGPVLRRSGDEAAQGCPEGGSFKTGFLVDAPPADCQCDCLPACGHPTLAAAATPGDTCASATTSTFMLSGYGCVAAPTGLATAIAVQVKSSPLDACPARFTSNKVAAQVTRLAALCQVAAGVGLCADGTCLDGSSLGETGGFCIFRDGVEECPAAYPKREFIATSTDELVDTRACSECSCGKPVTAPCKGKLQAYAAADCSGATIGEAIAVNGECKPTSFVGASGVATTFEGPTCEKIGGKPIGDAAPKAGAVTVCCPP